MLNVSGNRGRPRLHVRPRLDLRLVYSLDGVYPYQGPRLQAFTNADTLAKIWCGYYQGYYSMGWVTLLF